MHASDRTAVYWLATKIQQSGTGRKVRLSDFVFWPPKGHGCVGGSYSQSGTGAASSVLQVLECHMVLGGSSSSAYTEGNLRSTE